MVTQRVLKKISTPFNQFKPDGAILVINMVDPQISTMKVFLDATQDVKMPFFAIGNKIDQSNQKQVKKVSQQLKLDIIPASMTKEIGINKIKKAIDTQLKKSKRIAVLGVFNSGKTSLISCLTGKTLKIGDLPGTTLEFTDHQYGNKTLIDTVGQVIDISKPMMVSVDLADCKTRQEKILKVMKEDAQGILASCETAIYGLKKLITVAKRQIKKGKKIIVTGAGASSLVALEMAGQGLETGVPIMVFTNNMAEAQPVSFSKGTAEEEGGLSRYINFTVQKGDIVIGISASGGTGFVYDALKRARKKKAITVAITENVDTPLGKMADIVIKSNAKPEGPSSSKIQAAHLAIGHAFLVTLAEERGITAEQSIGYMLPERVATKKMGIK